MTKFIPALIVLATLSLAIAEPLSAQTTETKGSETSERFSGNTPCGPNPNRGR